MRGDDILAVSIELTCPRESTEVLNILSGLMVSVARDLELLSDFLDRGTLSALDKRVGHVNKEIGLDVLLSNFCG